jgi:hypothetical protein
MMSLIYDKGYYRALDRLVSGVSGGYKKQSNAKPMMFVRIILEEELI